MDVPPPHYSLLPHVLCCLWASWSNWPECWAERRPLDWYPSPPAKHRQKHSHNSSWYPNELIGSTLTVESLYVCFWSLKTVQTSNRAMFLPSYCWLFSTSLAALLLMKGLLSLGLTSTETQKHKPADLNYNITFKPFLFFICSEEWCEVFTVEKKSLHKTDAVAGMDWPAVRPRNAFQALLTSCVHVSKVKQAKYAFEVFKS